jgi:hypothetical protein
VNPRKIHIFDVVIFICIPAVTHLHVEKNTSASGWVNFDDPVIRQTSDIGNVHHKFLRDVAEFKKKKNSLSSNSEINYAEPKKFLRCG